MKCFVYVEPSQNAFFLYYKTLLGVYIILSVLNRPDRFPESSFGLSPSALYAPAFDWKMYEREADNAGNGFKVVAAQRKDKEYNGGGERSTKRRQRLL